MTKTPIYTYFEKKYDQIFHASMYFFTNYKVCMQLTRATTRDVVCI